MTIRRLLLTTIALALMLPLCGCACHRRCCGDDTRSMAPPSQGCCPKPPPVGYIPPPGAMNP
jgi:hypothetical protein